MISNFADLFIEQFALQHTKNNRQEIEQSKFCGCLNCLKTFDANKIKNWENNTAICPECGVPRIIASVVVYSLSRG